MKKKLDSFINETFCSRAKIVMVVPNFWEKSTLLTFEGIGGGQIFIFSKKIFFHDNQHGHGDILRSEQR